MLTNERLLSHEVREAFLLILSVAKVLEGTDTLTTEDRENMAENLVTPLYDLAAIIGEHAARGELATLASNCGLEGWAE